jgi:hypothetical protein
MNQLAPTEPMLPGLLPNVEALELANSFGAGIDGLEIVVNRMPTMIERQVMAERNNALAHALVPIGERREDQVQAAAVIASLLVGYSSARKDKAAAETVTVYLEHLKGVPLFAIRAACEDVKAGRVYDVEKRTGNRIPLDPDFPPSTVRLRTVARRHVDVLASEKDRFDRVLRARRTLPPPISQAERELVGERFKDLQAEMRSRSAAADLEEAARKVERAADQRARGDRLIRAEYEALGLVPPTTDGGALVSLSMLRSAGWTVQETPFGRELIRPGAAHG